MYEPREAIFIIIWQTGRYLQSRFIAVIPLKNVSFEVFTVLTMKNVVFWDIKTQLLPHKEHVTSPLQSPVS
jgi:hypothetical protein